MKRIFLITSLFIGLIGWAQKSPKTQAEEDFFIIKNDSLTIPLEEVVVLNKRDFNTDKERRYYYWYYKKVMKAYPFAKLAAEKLTEINQELEGIKSKRKRKKHIKRIQKFMEEEFTPQLKKLTRTEGRILIKLVHRQTGETMYELIKEYRSGWKAFWYNSTANLFKLSLKEAYEPDTVALDFVVEDILQRAFISGKLDKQQDQLDLDYFELLDQWDDINIEKEITAYIDKYMK